MMTFRSLPSQCCLDGLDLFEQIVPALILDPADVDDHVDLVRAVLDGVEQLQGTWPSSCRSRSGSR